MRRFNWWTVPVIAAACLAAASPARGQITVVNMIPQVNSGETNQDSEPNLAVNPSNPLQIAGSAFTPDPLGGNAPIFVSTNGGNTWLMNPIVPNAAGQMTSDITVRFGGTSNELYAGTLRRPGSLRLNIMRTNNFVGPAAMTVLVDRNQVDQPYVQAATVLGGPGAGRDRVFVGNNDFGAGTRTATIDRSLDALAAAPTFNALRIETRDTSGQDLPPIRPAVHLDGTVYGVFYRRYNPGGGNVSDVIVVRDDNWATGPTTFAALNDPGDGLPGRRVVTGINVPFENFSHPDFGQERLVASNLSIAVDPRDSRIVFIAWADRAGAGPYTLHVRRSGDRGVSWSATDIRTIARATNPALAINSLGRVGFMYQQVTGDGAAQRWVTHLERTSDNFTTINDAVLANVPANAPAPTFIPYIGDYIHLMAVGKNFYGIFSANNTPNNTNFPSGVTFGRNANFVANTLLDVDNTTPVPVSIDPFFVRADEVAPREDLYVADWNDNATTRDQGQEPSTRPVFYTTSDVWNRRTDAPGAFNASNQPANQEPQMISLGDNFAFTRVRRNESGTAATATLRFLYSEFGTGSNYQEAGSGALPTLAFAAADLEKTMAAGKAWQLPVTTSTHLCQAVEISTPNDPFIPPSLLGAAPGWWTGTDLRVLSDNNKAQRNMGVYPATGTGQLAYFALLHNPGLIRHDMVLRYDAPRDAQSLLQEARLGLISGEERLELRDIRPGGTITAKSMAPGENRWVMLTLPVPRERRQVPVRFTELVANAPVGGFTIAIQPAAPDRVARANLELHAQSLLRAAEGLALPEAREPAEKAVRMLRARELAMPDYVSFLRANQELLARLTEKLTGPSDAFGAREAAARLADALKGGSEEKILPAHSALAHTLDAVVTARLKQIGDTADIVQTLRLQDQLYSGKPALSGLPGASAMIGAMRKYVNQYLERKVGPAEYPALVRDALGTYKETARAINQPALGLEQDIEAMERALNSPAATQKAQCRFLVKLLELP